MRKGGIRLTCRPLFWVLAAAMTAAMSAMFTHAALSDSLALVGAKVYPAPGAPPLETATVVVEDGRLTAVGPADATPVPEGADIIPAEGAFVTAGLWNTHVHFSLPPLDTLPAERIQGYILDMLLQYGFTSVVDTGSAPDVTLGLRRRIENSTLNGPYIVMAGGSLVPNGASPFYLRPMVLPGAESAAQASGMVNQVLDFGADGIKIYSGSIVSVIEVVPMDEDIVRAVTDAAHARGAFVMAHPSNTAGAWAAIKGGVDIFTHALPHEGWDPAIFTAMLDCGMALIPTLKLYRFDGPRFGQTPQEIRNTISLAQAQLKLFSDLGGDVMFGTDVGYITDFDPTDEYVYMQEAGLGFDQILASLTTTPARRFGRGDRAGKVISGMDADLTVFDRDPAVDITAFARPSLVVKRGEILFRRAD